MSDSDFTDGDEGKKEMISVEVAYATPEKQLILAITVPLGTTAYEAVQLSRISEDFSSIDINKDPMGIFSKPLGGKGRPTPKKYQLAAGDRVEIYRPLIIDPKRARLDRAKIARLGKKQAEKSKG